MTQSLITTVNATGEEISRIVGSLEKVINDLGVPRPQAFIATLSMSLILMNPEISTEDLYKGVQDVSRFICLLLDGDGEPVTKGMMN